MLTHFFLNSFHNNLYYVRIYNSINSFYVVNYIDHTNYIFYINNYNNDSYVICKFKILSIWVQNLISIASLVDVNFIYYIYYILKWLPSSMIGFQVLNSFYARLVKRANKIFTFICLLIITLVVIRNNRIPWVYGFAHVLFYKRIIY